MSTVSGISNMREAAVPPAKSGVSKPVSPQQKIANLFQQIDTAGTGRITKVQFEQAFSKLNPPEAVKAMGANAAFSKLDPTGSGSVSKQDFIKGMESIVAQATQPKKEAVAKVNAAPDMQGQANSAPAPNAAAPVPAASGPIGNTINITA